MMINIYLKSAIRNILKNKLYAFIIIIGLVLGTSTSIFIYFYVSYEKSYDRFLADAGQLYRINVYNLEKGEDAYKSPYSFAAQGPTALREVPEITDYVRLSYDGHITITSNSSNAFAKTFNIENYYLADSNFFNLFSFPLVKGNTNDVLTNPGSVVISESLSAKLFEVNHQVLGSRILLNGKHPYTVTGVMKNPPANSHLKFEAIITLSGENWVHDNDWSNHRFFTYVKLKKGADIKKAESNLVNAFNVHTSHLGQSHWQLQNIRESYLNSTDFTSTPSFFKFGNEKYVQFLTIIAIIILMIAWVNYINIFTSKLKERLNDVGVRKINGADRKNILLHIFTETGLYHFFSLVLALILILIVFTFLKYQLPFLNGSLISLLHSNNLTGIIVTVFITGTLFTGLYPAIAIAFIRPDRIMNTNGKSVPGLNLRATLIISQFIIVIALILFTAHVNKQLNYLYSQDLGFKKDQVLILRAPKNLTSEKLLQKIEIFKNEILKIPGISDLSASQSVPGNRFGFGNSVIRPDAENENDYTRVGYIFSNFLDFYQIQFVAGENFKYNNLPDLNAAIINESKVKQLAFTSPTEAIGKTLNWQGNKLNIIGVVKDFHQESFHKSYEPMLFQLKNVNCEYISIKFSNTQNISSKIHEIESDYKSIFSDSPFDFFFLNDYFNTQYLKENQFQKIFSYFSFLAIIIGFLGLYGLTTYGVNKRIKEIGVRKVNGATIIEILTLLNIDFIKWIVVAIMIAIPISRIFILKWLENFAFKIEMKPSIFYITGICIFVSVVIIISLQSWKIATKNPVEALRYE